MGNGFDPMQLKTLAKAATEALQKKMAEDPAIAKSSTLAEAYWIDWCKKNEAEELVRAFCAGQVRPTYGKDATIGVKFLDYDQVPGR